MSDRLLRKIDGEDPWVKAGKLVSRARAELNGKEFTRWLENCYNYFCTRATDSMFNFFEKEIDKVLKNRI